MPAFLLTWNPDRWSWEDLHRELTEFRNTGVLTRRWSCGRSKALANGDRVFFLKQGSRGRGIYASGYVQGNVFEDQHFAEPTKKSRYVTVAYDVFLDPDTALLPRDRLEDEPLSRVHWSTQGGGIGIPTEALGALESLWETHVRSLGIGPQTVSFSDDEDLVFVEGASRPITVRAFERSSEARRKCIEVKGLACRVCGLDFGRVYGEIGKGFIHVHHSSPLASGRGEHRVTAVADLEPVCPNCHNMIHRRRPPYTIEELRRVMSEHAAGLP